MTDDDDYIDHLCNPNKYENEKKKKDKKQRESKPIETSKIIKDGVLWEEIFDPITKQAKFINYDREHNQPVCVDHELINGIKHNPIIDDLLLKGAIILPSGIMDYGSEESLRNDIATFIYKYLDVSDEHRKKAAMYVELTHVHDNINTIPYLRALGDYGTGKTRYEDTIGGICYKPMYVGGSVRSAPIYRVIDKWRGTAIFDEFTLGKSDETQDITQILNNGFQRQKPVLRCKDGNYSVVECFDPFGPKILACRKPFEDRALESRCITEIITETSRNDIPIDLGPTFKQERQELQNKLLFYRLKFWDKVIPDENLHIDFGHIQPRIKQSFLPFVVLFQNDSDLLTNFIATVKQYNDALIEENSTSRDGVVVRSFLTLLKIDGAVVTPKVIRDDIVENHGFDPEKTNVRNVGRWLHTLGFKATPTTIKEKTYRILTIDPEIMKKLIYRYIPTNEHDECVQIIENLPKKPKQDHFDFTNEVVK